MAPVSPSQAQSFGDLRIDGQGNQLIINQVVQISASEITTQPFNPSSPYLGLRRFEERHRDLFFGRDRLVGSLLQTVAKSSFLLVAGASGSGKSSVVRAGLIPQLLQRLDPARFRPLVLTPDRDPFAALRSALIAAGYDQADTDVLEARSAASVVRAASELRAPGDLWLVFIDQFEQIFTRCADEATRTAFLDGLVTLCEAPQQEVKVVLAMRADFLDRLSASPRLGALAERSLRLVTEMQPDELRAAIEQPAAHHGVVFESGLVEQILAEVRGRAASLPLLQFMLDLLWREDEPASDRTLNVATYHRIGGVQGALRARADDLYEHSRRSRGKERPPEEQAAMRRVFLRLVDFSGGAEGTVVSRRALRTEFQSELERRIIDELIDEALLVSDAQLPEQAGASGGTLEVAHEAMLTAWPRLTTWLTEGREVIVARNRLATDAARWLRVRGKEPAQADEELWTGVRLQQALELRARGDFANLLGGLSAPEAEFLDASDALRQTRARAEQEGKEKLQRAEREKRELRIRLLRITGAALTLFLAIAILAAIGARHEQKVAEREAHRAQQINLDLYVDKGRDLLFEQRGAEALAWLAEAYIQGSQNRDLPILLMQARWAAESLLATLPHKPPIREMVLSADGTKLAVLDASPEASVWELPSGKILWRLEVAATTLAFNPAGTQLAAGKAVGAIDIWNLADGKRIRRLMKHTDAVTSIDFSPDGTRLLSGGRDKLAFVWDLSSGELLHALPEHKEAVNQVEYSPTGTSFVTSARFESIQIWDANSGAQILLLERKKEDAIGKIAKYSPRGNYVATTGFWATKIWNAYTGDPIIAYNANEIFENIAFDPNETAVSYGLSGGTALILKINNQASGLPMRAHKVRANEVAYSPSGDLLLTAAADRQAKVWDAHQRESWAVLQGHTESVTKLIVHPTGNLTITGSADGTARLWATRGVANVATIGTGNQRLITALFSQDGSTGFTATDDGTVRLTNKDKKMSIYLGGASVLVAASLDANGERICTIDRDGTVHLWEEGKGKRISLVSGDDTPISDARFARGCGLLAIEQVKTGKIRLWNMLLGKEYAAFGGNKFSEYRIVDFSNDGDTLLLVGPSPKNSMYIARSISNFQPEELPSEGGRGRIGDGLFALESKENRLILYDSKNKSSIRCYKHLSWLKDIHFSADMLQVITASNDQTAQICDTRTGQPLSILEGAGPINRARLDRRGERALTAHKDRTARIWNARTGLLLAVLRGHRSEVVAAEFNPDGKHMLTAEENGLALLWDLSDESRYPLAGPERQQSVAELKEFQRCRSWFRFRDLAVLPQDPSKEPNCPVHKVPEIPIRFEEGKDLLGSGRLASWRRNFPVALGHYSAASRVFEHLNEPLWQAESELRVAAVTLASSDSVKARSHIDKALVLIAQAVGEKPLDVANKLRRLAFQFLRQENSPELGKILCEEAEARAPNDPPVRRGCLEMRLATGQLEAVLSTAPDILALAGNPHEQTAVAALAWSAAVLLDRAPAQKRWQEELTRRYGTRPIGEKPNFTFFGTIEVLERLAPTSPRHQKVLNLLTLLDEPRIETKQTPSTDSRLKTLLVPRGSVH